MSAQTVTISDPDHWCVDDEEHVVEFTLTSNHATVVRVSTDVLQQLVDAAAARGIVAR
jgi:hypothetical protein